jgi:HEAT repeat protein
MLPCVRPSTLLLIGLLLLPSLSAEAAFWPSAVLSVEHDLHSQDSDVRRRAAQTLRDLPASSGARLARVALVDSDVEVRLSALDTCLALGLPGLGELLVPWLTDGERRLRLAAAEGLSESPTARALPALGRALADADAPVRSAAASALGKSAAPEAVLALLGHMDDSAPEVRQSVALALGELADARAVVPLIGKIQDPRPTVREAVADALAQLADARATSALVLALHDSDDAVKIAALRALARISDPNVVPSIRALLPNASDTVLPALLDALSHIHTPAANKLLIEQLDVERPGGARADVVQALGRAGATALPALRACLHAESDPERLAGCALALGQTEDVEGSGAIQDALRRGALGPMPALLALSELRAPESLPTVLEYLSSTDALERHAARGAALSLLDPRQPDGRAVEPIAQALSMAHNSRVEQRELLDLLGHTGSPRALASLLPFAGPGADLSLRTQALAALGWIGEAGQFPALLRALDDESGSVRLAAALALGRLPLTGQTLTLLDRLQKSSQQMRPLLLLALGGTVSVSRDPRVLSRLLSLLGDAQGGERDALIELLGRMPMPEATASLAQFALGSPVPAERAKFAEALAAQPAERTRLARLLGDASATVRANAAWSLGEIANPSDGALLTVALRDSDVSVAGNALSALARIALRSHTQIATTACPFSSDPRRLMRALSMRALRLTGERCEHGEERTVLARDRWEFARMSAAALLRDVPRGAADEEVLTRARDRDPSGAVAAECSAPSARKASGAEPTVIVVIPAGDDLPRPEQPFALLRADGLVRLGVSDRRGQVFEVAAPLGSLSLIERARDFE